MINIDVNKEKKVTHSDDVTEEEKIAFLTHQQVFSKNNVKAPEKENIYGLRLDKLEQEMIALGQKAYRATQIFQWLYQKKVSSFDEMTDISQSFREVLKSKYEFYRPKPIIEEDSKDGTVKTLSRLYDGSDIETVLMRYDYGDSVCVTSEVGCNMGCEFCASGLIKKSRGLSTGEMVGQVMNMDELLRKKDPNLHVTHVVVMGIGEPMDNYNNVLDFIRIINNQKGLAIGARHITVSTCGIVPGILRFGKEGLQVNLAISLHAPNDEIRRKIMPVAKAFPLPKLISAIMQYGKDSGGRRVTYEYILLKGINDSVDNAKELAKLIKPTFGYVNLIPYNRVAEKPYERSDRETIKKFQDVLLKSGIKATIRKEFGSDIDAACGQLRAKHEKVIK